MNKNVPYDELRQFFKSGVLLVPRRGPFLARPSNKGAASVEPELPAGIGIMVPYSAIAPGQPSNEEAMLEALSHLTRDDGLLACATANIIATGFDVQLGNLDRQRRLVQMFCDPEQGRLLDEFAKKHGGQKVAVFFEGQLLELARWIAKHCRVDTTASETFADPTVRSAFVRAALIASDMWNARVYADRFQNTGSGEEQLKRIVGAFRKGMEQSTEAEHTGVAIGRAALLFREHLPKRLPRLEGLFKQTTGMTIDSYMTCVCALLMYTFPSREEGPMFRTHYVAEATAFAEQFDKFIALRSQTPEALAERIWDNFAKEEYRGLRTKPILNVAQGRSIILDPCYFTESMTVGPLFDLLSAGDRENVLSAFGGAFEDYITSHLRDMFPGSAALPSRLSTGVKGKDAGGHEFECDAILNDVFEAYVMEIKASWIREDSILTDDPADFIQELMKKYGLTSELKGIAQLARSIGAIARREWKGEHGELSQVKRLYPLLIVHDEKLSSPGIVPILNLEFRRLLGDLPAGCVVDNLIMLTVFDLENLTSSLENFGFTAFLQDYSAQVPDRASSVRNFMSGPKYGPQVKPSAKLRAATDELMEAVKAQLFPKTGEPDELV